ncbi:Os09g0327150, partial [Oryza sativa Japonica Group]
MACHVVHDKCANCPSIVCTCNRPIPVERRDQPNWPQCRTKQCWMMNRSEQRACGTTREREQEKREREGTSPLLAGGVPDLGLDDLVVDADAPGGELDADGGLGLEAELVAGEAGEEV